MMLLLSAAFVHGAAFVEHELVLKLNEGFTIDTINNLYGTVDIQHLPQIDVYLMNAPAGTDADLIAEQISSEPFVNFCHPNYLVDPLQPVQGSIPFGDENLQGEYEEQYAAQELNLGDVHGISTGSNVRVAVIDGGINLNHPAFDGTVLSGWDYVDEDPEAFDEPGGTNTGHGTFVAGVVHLVAPSAEIISYRVTNLGGASNGYVVAEAIMQAVTDSCRVINLSLVTTAEHLAIATAVEWAKQNNVMVVVAAGNGQDSPIHYPASDDNTVAVAAVDSNLTLADFSSFGDYVDVCAPGVMVYAPYLDSTYAWWGGTSFAAPFVTGLAALLASIDPELTADQIRDTILTTAIPIDSLNFGYDGQLGAGFIDPLTAILTLIDGATTLHVPSEYPSITDALADAYHGDTILVAPGTYYGSILIQSKSVKIISEGGPEVTFLRPLNDCNAYILKLYGSFLETVELRGFTIEHARGKESTVWNQSCDLLIENCIFRDNNLLEFNSPVVRCERGTITLDHCLFYNNPTGYCVLYSYYGSGNVNNCTFDGNHYGVYVQSHTGMVQARNNIFSNSTNTAIITNDSCYVDYNNFFNNYRDYSNYNYAGENDFNVDPLYVDEMGYDYRLRPNSPCIDAGDPDPAFNDPDGSRNDVGSIFYQTVNLPLASRVTVLPGDSTGMVTSLRPVFHWTYIDTGTVDQVGLQIQIGLDDDWSSAEVWDSHGVTTSADSLVYNSYDLTDATYYFARMRVRDNQGYGDWTEFRFSTSVTTVIHVPSDAPTIQAAINLANNGDTIIVADGTYTENLNFEEKFLVLLSEAGAENTILTAAGGATPLIMMSAEYDNGTIIEGFTFTDGETGIAAPYGQSAEIRNCRFIDLSGNAISSEYGANWLIENSLFDSVMCSIRLEKGSCIFENNLVRNCFEVSSYRSALSFTSCDSCLISGNRFYNNALDWGIYVNGGSEHIIVNNTVYGTGDYGYGLYPSGNLDYRNNLSAYNGLYGVISNDNADLTIEYSGFYGNGLNATNQATAGIGCIYEDPLFVFETGSDLDLLSGSPCIDAGDPDPIYNDADGSRSDIGAVSKSISYPTASQIVVSPTDSYGYVTTLIPTINWIYLDTLATSQTQYQIQVGTDQEWTEAEFWDSGPISSAAQSAEYAGATLDPFIHYGLRIRVHDGTDWGEWAHYSFIIKLGPVIHVPDEINSIAGAIKFVCDGDTVLVSPGTYSEFVKVTDKHFVLMSSDGAGSTFWEAPENTWAALRLVGAMDTTTVVQGFTFSNRTAQIECWSGANALIQDNIFDSVGVPFDITSHTSPVIRNNVTRYANRVFDSWCSSAVIEGNIFTDMVLDDYSRAVDLEICDGAIVRNNIFARMQMVNRASVIRLSDGDSAYVYNNTFYDISGDGVETACILSLYSGGNHRIFNNIFAFCPNTIAVLEGDVQVESTIEYNDLYECSGGYVGVNPGIGSIMADPMFADTALLDMSLTSSSPCIDAGNPSPDFNDPDGTVGDMGAFPFTGPYNLPLAQNINVLPGDLYHIIGQTPAIYWHFYDSLGSAQGYEIQLGTDSDWSIAEMWETGPVMTTDTSAIYNGATLLGNVIYLLRIRLYNGVDWGEWRQAIFRTNVAPTTPEALSPEDGATLNGSGPLMIAASTDVNGDQIYYDFEIYRDAAATDLALSKLGITSSGDTVSSGSFDMKNEGTYWWRARATDGYENSEYTDLRAFYGIPTIYLFDITSGSIESSILECGQPVNLRFNVANEYNTGIQAMANAFRIYSPDGAAWNTTDAVWAANSGWRDIFNLMVFDTAYIGDDVDTMVFAGVNLSGGAFLPGEVKEAWNIKLSVDCDNEGRTICIDSIDQMSALVWLWQGTSDTYYPPWSGPYCLSVIKCCEGLRGNVNGDETNADITDLLYLVNYMFQNGPDPVCMSEANINGDAAASIDITDLTAMVAYMFASGTGVCDCDSTAQFVGRLAATNEEMKAWTYYHNDSTFVMMEAPGTPLGVQLEMIGHDRFDPISQLPVQIELFAGQRDSAVTVGMLDINDRTPFPEGTITLLATPGTFELVNALASDIDHQPWIGRISNGLAAPGLPTTYSLGQNYPNPFNASTNISFSLPEPARVKLEVFNILGQKVVTLVDNNMAAGNYSLLWDGRSGQHNSVASGVYFYRLTTERFIQSKKMLLLK